MLITNSKIKIFFWTIAIIFAFVQCCLTKSMLTVDQGGIAYLDIADAYLRRDWNVVFHLYFSPLYPAVLAFFFYVFKPSIFWEIPVVHLANFFIFLFNLIIFEFFLKQFIKYNCKDTSFVTMWLVLGYSLFIWSSLNLISTTIVTPDLLAAGFLYLSLGALFLILNGSYALTNFVFLGMALGLAYFSRTFMFLIDLLLIALSMFYLRKNKTVLQRFFITLAIFFLISSPLISILSKEAHKLTIGESGRTTYRWLSAKENILTTNKDPNLYYTRIALLEEPRIYHYTHTPKYVTYPEIYGWSYWNYYEQITFDIKRQMLSILDSLKSLCSIFFVEGLIIFLGFLILLALCFKQKSFTLKLSNGSVILLLISISVFLLYSLITILSKYVGAFIVLFWLALMFSLPLHNIRNSIKCKSVVFTVSFALLLQVCFANYRHYCSSWKRSDGKSEVAMELKKLGIKEGDPIALLGSHEDVVVARLLRARIIASIHQDTYKEYLSLVKLVNEDVIKIFEKTPAKIVIGQFPPLLNPDKKWIKIKNINYYIRVLRQSTS